MKKIDFLLRFRSMDWILKLYRFLSYTAVAHRVDIGVLQQLTVDMEVALPA